jgi:hypothetical protein
VFQVGFAGLSPSSQQLLLQLEAVYDLLQSLSTSPAAEDIVTQYSVELSGQDMKAADGQGPAQVVSQDVEDQLEAEHMPEDEKKEAAEQNNEAKSEATAPATPLPDLVTWHRPLGAPVATAIGPSCHANELNHRLPDLVLSGLRRPPEERNLSAGRRAVINTADLSDDASLSTDAATAIGQLCLRPPVGRLSSHTVLSAALAAKTRRRRCFRIAERHGAAAGGTDVLRAGGGFHPLLRRAVVWRQAGAELATIADSLMAVSGSGGRLVVAVANPRQLAAANQRINSEEEEDVMMDSWEAVSGLLLAVMARAVLYACLSRLKRLLF